MMSDEEESRSPTYAFDEHILRLFVGHFTSFVSPESETLHIYEHLHTFCQTAHVKKAFFLGI